MGFLRGAGIVILSVLLIVSIIAAGFFAVLSSSLTYERVEPQVHSIAEDIINEQIGKITIVDTLTPYLSEYCLENPDITYKFQGYTFVFPCSVVANGTNSIVDYGVNYLVQDFYYKKYTCDFWKCFGESNIPLFLVSGYARDYWKARFYNALLISVILAAGTILLCRKKANGFILAGILTILSSLLILQLKKIGAFTANLVLSPVSTAISGETSQKILSQVVGIFFSASGSVFLWMFILGFVLFGTGIILRMMGIGFKISSAVEKRQERIRMKEEAPPKKAKISKGMKASKKQKKK